MPHDALAREVGEAVRQAVAEALPAAVRQVLDVVNGDRPPKAELLGVDDVAATIGVSVRSVWRLVSGGHLPEPVRVGRAARWRRRDVERFLGSLKPGVTIQLPRDAG